jgi:hypothetical protein
MKNSAKYARKIKPLLSGAKKAEKPEQVDEIRLLLEAVMQENAASKQAAEGVAVLEQEFVDFNELRVSPPKDIVERLDRSFPNARAKAEAVTRALNAVFSRANVLSMEYLAKKPKRDIRRALREELGLSPYAESVLTLCAFDGHAVPVDTLLLEALKLDKYIHPDSDVPDLQGFLERIILSKNALAAHEALRAYASKAAPRVARELARRAKKAAAARAKAEAARARAEAVERRAAERKEAAAKKAKDAAAKKAKEAAAKKAAKAASKKAAKKTRKAAAARKRPRKLAKK